MTGACVVTGYFEVFREPRMAGAERWEGGFETRYGVLVDSGS